MFGTFDWRTDLDYDGFDWGESTRPFFFNGTTYTNLESFSAGTGQEANGIRISHQTCIPTMDVPGDSPTPVPPQYLALARRLPGDRCRRDPAQHQRWLCRKRTGPGRLRGRPTAADLWSASGTVAIRLERPSVLYTVKGLSSALEMSSSASGCASDSV